MEGLPSCGGNEVPPTPKSHEAWRGAGSRGKVPLCWPLTRSRGKTRLQSLGLSFFCADPPKGVRLLFKGDLCFLLQSPLGACARPLRQVARRTRMSSLGLAGPQGGEHEAIASRDQGLRI